MFPFRMAQAPAFYALYALIFLIPLSHAVSQLPRELSNLIPGCAEQCFLSFLEVHFDGSDCSESLSLQCLCSTSGATAFTIGEGAVQCITAEKRFGNCSEFAASDAVLSAAYRMCDDQPNAIQPTHEVITASLILPSSSGGVVKFPPVRTTAPEPSEQPQPTGSPTTLITDTGLPPIIPTVTTRPPPESTTDESSTLITTTRPPAQDTTTTSPSQTSTDNSPLPPAETETGDDNEDDDDSANDDGAEDDDDPGNLSPPQIAGISVGVAAAGAVAILAIILARRCRRQNHPGLKTAFLPRRSTWGPKFNPNQRDSTHSWVANQLRAPLDAADILPPPPAYQQRPAAGQDTWRQNGLGVTIQSSPQIPASVIDVPVAVVQDRRVSKLLPAKPEMSPTPPGNAWRSYQQGGPSQPAEPSAKTSPLQRINMPSVQDPAGSSQGRPQPPVALKLQIPEPKDLTKAPSKGNYPRDSSITQFEEDSILSPEGQIWRPPSSAPLTAMPIYIADKNGNWVLASPTKQWPANNPGMASVPDSTTVGAALTTPGNNATQTNPRGSGSDMGQTRASAQQSLAPAARIVRTSDGSSTFRHSASVYSQHSSVPRPLFYFNPRQSSAPPHPAPPASYAYRPQPPMRNASDDSDETVFESSSSGGSKDPTPPEIRNTLTPVIESPFANNGSFAAGSNLAGPDASGRSGLGLDFFSQNNNGSNMANRYRPNINQPPPTRPMNYYPPGQPSPTLGMMGSQPPPTGGSGMSSLNVPQKGRTPMDATRLGGSSQPATMRIVEPSPEPEDSAMRSAGSRVSRPSPFNSGPSPSGRSGPVHPQQFGLPARPNVLPVRPGPQPQQQQRYPNQQPPPQGQQRQRMPPFQYGLPPGPRPQPYPTPYHPQQRRPQQQAPQQYQPQSQAPQQYQQSPPPPPSLDTQIPPIGRSPADFQSPASERTVSSTASSLLAKRLGNDRAVQMAMPINASSSSSQQQQQQQKWQRGNFLSPEPTTPKMPNDLPSTPTWVPKLTPTRRGDDLFLNVQ